MPSGDTAVILPFPLVNHFAQADVAAVEAWARHAQQRGWFVRAASTPGVGGVGWIDRAPEGCERFTVAFGHPGNSAYYTVTRRGRRWLLESMHGDGEPMGEFKCIQSVLDVICPPAPGVA